MAKYSSGKSSTGVLIGGMAAGILASRVLPPLFAMAAGAIKTGRKGDPFAPLVKEHRQMLTLLDRMERSRDASRAYRGMLFLSLKRLLGKHSLAEEDIVYPLLHEKSGEDKEVKHMYDEHADIKIALYRIEQSLMENRDWTEQVRWLRDMVEHHARDEETTEFPKLRRMLDERKRRMVGGNIQREEAMML